MRIIKTVQVTPNTLHHRVVAAIMAKLQLKEIQRVVVGGHMSEVGIVLTFEGGDDYLKVMKNKYIEVLPKNPDREHSTYYCYELLDGWCGTFDSFKAQVKKIREGQSDFEFKELTGL